MGGLNYQIKNLCIPRQNRLPCSFHYERGDRRKPIGRTHDNGSRYESDLQRNREARFKNGRSYRTESPVTKTRKVSDICPDWLFEEAPNGAPTRCGDASRFRETVNA